MFIIQFQICYITYFKKNNEKCVCQYVRWYFILLFFFFGICEMFLLDKRWESDINHNSLDTTFSGKYLDQRGMK
jgi:hypothetical protein